MRLALGCVLYFGSQVLGFEVIGTEKSPVVENQSYRRPDPICTNSSTAPGSIGIGFKFCGPRQLSSIPTCCTQDTVHRGAQNFSVEYSRCRISGEYCASGIPGYPRCCEHQCTNPNSQMYK